MPEEKFTRCPSCRTVFRVTQAQLAMRAGQVRCGHCHTVFDGIAHLVSLAPPAEGEDSGIVDEAAMGPPTVTLRSARALGVPPAEDGDVADEAVSASAAEGAGVPAAGAAAPARAEASLDSDAPAAASSASEDAPSPGSSGGTTVPGAGKDDGAGAREGDDAAASRDAAAAPRPRRTALVWALGSALLVVVLAAQAIFHFRDAISARWPATAAALTKACAIAGCTVGPPHDIAELAIQSSDLQADPAHRGLLILTATVRNRSPRTLAYPHLELTLTDAQDQVVVRRAFAPTEYLGGTADLAAGIPANADVAIKLFIDASATSQAGYRLYLFYL